MSRFYKDRKVTEYNGIRFDSVSESKIFKLLEKYFNKEYKVEVHYKIQCSLQCAWKVDFKVTALTASAMERLSRILFLQYGYDYPAKIPYLYLEYKGYIDENTQRKITELVYGGKTVLDVLLLVSDKATAIAVEDPNSWKTYLIPVMSKDRFIRLLQSTM